MDKESTCFFFFLFSFYSFVVFSGWTHTFINLHIPGYICLSVQFYTNFSRIDRNLSNKIVLDFVSLTYKQGNKVASTQRVIKRAVNVTMKKGQ